MLRILSGQFKGRLLKTPKGDKTRPTSSKIRGVVFDILRERVEGAVFLDLFAGSGAMGIEALSRGASRAVFVDQDFQALRCIQENLKALEIENSEVYPLEASYALKRLKSKGISFDLIYIDPPYMQKTGGLLDAVSALLHKEGLIIFEQGKKANSVSYELKVVDERVLGDVKLTFFSHKNFL